MFTKIVSLMTITSILFFFFAMKHHWRRSCDCHSLACVLNVWQFQRKGVLNSKLLLWKVLLMGIMHIYFYMPLHLTRYIITFFLFNFAWISGCANQYSCATWTGGNDILVENSFVWETTNTPFTYTNWEGINPNDSRDQRRLDCVEIFYTGQCDKLKPSICEKNQINICECELRKAWKFPVFISCNLI